MKRDLLHVVFRHALPVLVACTLTAAETVDATRSPAPLPTVNLRAGLPNIQAKVQAGQPVRVAYLGGSITASWGWRTLTTDFLKREFPQTTVEEIFAAIPGTGSDFGACRLETQVIEYRPDLLFVEFAVNDSAATETRIREAMEGIVRQTWQVNPSTDICFIYTISQDQFPDYEAGRSPKTGRVMDEVAAHYGIPSIYPGTEVARLATAGKLVMRGSSQGLDALGRDEDGRTVFTSDGIHPLPAGHRLYFSIIGPALKQMMTPPAGTSPSSRPHALPLPLTTAPWEHAGIVPVASASRSGAWEQIPAGDKRTAWQPAQLTPPLWLATQPGTSVTTPFKGTAIGLLGMKGPDNGRFRVTVDDLPPATGTFFDSFSVEGHYRLAVWWFPHALESGAHTVRVELLDEQIDKIPILKRRGHSPKDPAAFTPHQLYLCGFLLPDARP
ncbi:hypothetical protein OpiT1DRAFT_01866 [Opitutaceae bacterium TAV1]|nr:hypothetical protein OpiT1DRAFT_01866 [Opitutaceae bacterium TAV1]